MNYQRFCGFKGVLEVLDKLSNKIFFKKNFGKI